jgi:signal transduction histidine kinase
MPIVHADRDYSHVMRRTNAASAVGALAIQVLTVLSVSGNRAAMAWVVGTALLLVPFNIFVTAVLLPKLGGRAEVLRAAANVVAGFVVGHVAGWPLAHWLWLPYIAVTFDDFKDRTIWTVLGAACVGDAIISISDGVSWQIPLSFAVAAIFFRVITAGRMHTIREMLVDSHTQRAELDEAHSSLKRAHARVQVENEARLDAERDLRQVHKLEAVGRLAAGIAHEINTPLQFIMNSVQFIEEGTLDLLRLVEEARPSAALSDSDAEQVHFLRNELPDAIATTADGVTRVADIVATLKEFSRPEHRASAPVDVNRTVEAALLVAKHEYKYVADVETRLDDVPLVSGHAGELTQVLINLIVNAAHAVADVAGPENRRGRIRVHTMRSGDEVVIGIEDSGVGIPTENVHRVFEPFFTTKEPGRGSGQGLALAKTMVERQGGRLLFVSDPAIGTTFMVRLLIADVAARPSEAA